MHAVKKAFTEHPASVGETYFQHMRHSLGFSIKMIGGGLACMAHAIFPFLCVKTGSTQISNLHDRMLVNRDKQNERGHHHAGSGHTFIPEYHI